MIPKTSVLVVIDAQNGFMSEHSRPTVPVVVDLVTRWMDQGGDVVFTRYYNYDGSPYERLIHWSKVKGPPETSIVDELAPLAKRATAVIDKPIYSLFTPEAEQLFAEKGWKDVYICGFDTESCVLKTALDVFERDLTPWLIEDASASHAGAAAHEAGILIARRTVGKSQIIDSDKVLK